MCNRGRSFTTVILETGTVAFVVTQKYNDPLSQMNLDEIDVTHLLSMIRDLK